MKGLFAAVLGLLGAFPPGAIAPRGADDLTVLSVEPAPRSVGAPVESTVTVHFDRPVDPSSVTSLGSFWVFGRWSGTATGSFTFTDGGATVTLTPERPFSAGEGVTVLLSNQLAGLDGATMRQAGHGFQFWTAARPSSGEFIPADQLTTRTTPQASSRAYGGIATDLDGDGAPDLTIVNEDTSDLRVFLNRGDGSGLYDPFLRPTNPTGAVPSPAEPGDFDRDGHPDVAVANTVDSSVSILLGEGNGSFGPHQELFLGGTPRGIAVLDLDGDGDQDVAATNAPDSSLALLFNDGTGSFSPPALVGAGNLTEWALAAADMTEDGILDLVVGGQGSQTLWVYPGLGDGTLGVPSTHPAGGGVWMLVAGDLDGDGHDDVATANSFSDTGSILLGDGAGGLGRPETHPTDSFPLATDLGDLDGDGDLDWLTSSFGGDWALFSNDGSAGFSLEREFAAPQAASCALAVDMDGDGDLDLALVDELADVVLLQHREGGPIFADGFESGDVSGWSEVAAPPR